MAATASKPVVFLAFANDRYDTVGYLRNLPDESRRLRDVLEHAEQAGLCEVVVSNNSTAGDIFKVFQNRRYRNRIAIFHYGGHANGYQLLLESPEGKAAAADAGGLAAFLAQQQGLQLVFLNGCSTQPQTQELLDANISMVISTSRSIDDKVATDFACQFYQGLAGNASIRTAYKEAAASVRTAKGGNTRALYFGNKVDPKSQLEADRWPWNLYVREGFENGDQWDLSEAVGDPLFGLPALPELDLPEIPFRHLSWFTRKHADVFFGRGHQIRELYDRLTAPRSAPIILFYGQSGVGKSSVLHAGLIPRLEPDYEVQYRRREGSLLSTLEEVFPDAADTSIETAWLAKEEQTGKPLIVFLDQVEELYTRPGSGGPDNELNELLEVVKATFGDLSCRPQGKLVFGFRKEWLAELESSLIEYGLPRTKVFLEPLDRCGIIEVVQGPARSERLQESYGLIVEDGLAETIAYGLLEDRDSAIAPTLQILLTKMWTKAIETDYEKPRFSKELYQQLKRDGILLRDFLHQQIATFREQDSEAVDSGLLLDILALHTTALVTADEWSVEKLRQQYAHLADRLPALLQQCQDLCLLTVPASKRKQSRHKTSLAHDTLAPLVRERFDESDKPGQRARRILDNRSIDWSNDRTGDPLDEPDLLVVEQGLCGTRMLGTAELRLLDASRHEQAERQKNRKAASRFRIGAVAVICGLGVLGGIVSYIAVGKAREANLQTGNAFWQVATIARDDNLHVKAAHNFLRAAQAYHAADNQVLRQNVELAAQFESTSLVRSFPHDGKVLGAVFTGDGARVLSWSGSGAFTDTDGEVKLWDVTKTEPLQVWKHDDLVMGAVFTGDGARVLSWSRDGAVKLWDMTKAEPLQVWKHDDEVMGAVFTGDGARVLSWSGDGAVKLWDVTKAAPLQVWKHERRVWGAVFTGDGARVLSWSGDGAVKLWDVTKTAPLHVWKHDDFVNGAVFTGDGARVLSWSRDGAVKLWDVTKTEPLQVWKHDKRVNGALFTGDGARVLSWSGSHTGDGAVKLWDVTKTEPLQVWKHERRVWGAVFTGDGARVLSWDYDGAVKLCDVTKTEPHRVWKHDDFVNGAVFTGNEARVLSWSGDGEVKLWDVTKKEPLHVWRHDGGVNGAVFTGDEARVLSWGRDGAVKLWDVTKTEPLQVWKHDDEVMGAVFTGDEARVLSWSGPFGSFGDGAVKLWDVTKTEPLQVWKNDNRVMTVTLPGWTHERRRVNGAVFTGDKARVLSWDNDGAVKLWDVTKTEPLRVWKHKGSVAGAVFTGDEARVLSWSGSGWLTDTDGEVRLWDVTKTEPLQVWKHDDFVNGAVFTCDEARVLSWGRDGAVKLWDVTKAEPLHVWEHEGWVNGAVFTGDEARVLSWNDDGVKLWDMKLNDQDLTPAERILGLEVRSAIRLGVSGQLTKLSFAEWTALVRSDEYAAMQKKRFSNGPGTSK